MSKIRGLRGAIYDQFDTEADFARKLGWTRQKLNRITLGHKEPTVSEVNELATGLNISVEQVAGFFLRNMSPIEQPRVNMTPDQQERAGRGEMIK